MKKTETTTPKFKLKNGLTVNIYDDMTKPDGFVGTAILRRKEAPGSRSYFPQGASGHERLVELWSVEFPTGQTKDRWVSADDLVKK